MLYWILFLLEKKTHNTDRTIIISELVFQTLTFINLKNYFTNPNIAHYSEGLD